MFSTLRFVATFQCPTDISVVRAENDGLLSLALSSKGREGNGAAGSGHRDGFKDQGLESHSCSAVI